MSPKVPQDGIRERPRARAFERVAVGVVGEDAARVFFDRVAHLAQRGVARRRRERPVQHLSAAHEVPRVRHLVRVKLALPAHHQRVVRV